VVSNLAIKYTLFITTCCSNEQQNLNMKHTLFLIYTNLLHRYGDALPILNGVQLGRNIPLEV